MFAAIRDELMLDGNSRQNLATFCQTWVEEELHALMELCIDKNIEDKDEYPQTAEIEARCARSEAAMLGGLAMKRRWEARRRQQGQPTDRPNLVTGPVQICWHKFCRYWDIEHRELPMEPDRLLLSPEAALARCDANTIGVVPLGVGWVLWRETTDLPEEMVFWVNDLGGNMRDLTLNFSRPGGQVFCQYFNFLRLGREGYRKVHAACYATARYLADQIGRLGPFEIVFGGEDQAGIPAVCWKLRQGSAAPFNLYALADRLRVRGWQVPAYTLPAHCQEITVQRILVRHGVSRDLADLLLENIRQALACFESHPGQLSLSGEEASGFHH